MSARAPLLPVLLEPRRELLPLPSSVAAVREARAVAPSPGARARGSAPCAEREAGLARGAVVPFAKQGRRGPTGAPCGFMPHSAR